MFPAPLPQRIVSWPFRLTAGTDKLEASIRQQPNNQASVIFAHLFHTVPLESQGLSNYTFNEHESYPPSYRFRHQQELLDLIHAFKFYEPPSTHKFV
jgi:hypothetical protein